MICAGECMHELCELRLWWYAIDSIIVTIKGVTLFLLQSSFLPSRPCPILLSFCPRSRG